MTKKSIITALAISTLSTSAFAFNLKESVSEVLDTNPTVQERLKNFQEVQQDLNIAQSEWLPSLDYRATIGYVESGNVKDTGSNVRAGNNIDDASYRQYTHSLTLTQNIFNGFSTTNNIDYQESRVLVAAHNYVENANDIAFQMVESYINVIRSYQQFQNAQDNVLINEKIYEDVKSLYDAGLTTKSEMTKIFASLSLAKSNLLVQENNAKEARLRFKRLLGRDVSVSDLTMPKLNVPLPESLERATAFAIENNPSIIVGNYNVKGSQSLYKQKKGNFLPSVDLSVEQAYDGFHHDKGTPDGTSSDDLTTMLTLSWNLFKGGADWADLQKNRSSIAKEVEILRDLKRQLVEGLELSWASYEMLGNQLTELYEYQKYSQETLDGYLSEYELGRRTLLDLLSAQQDLNNSKSEIINAQLDKLFAQYRILDSMGLLVSTVLGDEIKYNQVIDPVLNPFEDRKQDLPVMLDSDKDGITDNIDICDNSLTSNNIKPYGCAENINDMDYDGIADEIDMCPQTKIGDIVDAKGCSSRDGANKFKVDRDAYIRPVAAYNEQSPQKSEESGLYAYSYSVNPDLNEKSSNLDNHLLNGKFSLIKRFDSIQINDIDENKIVEIANKIKEFQNDKISVTIIGNSKIDSSVSEEAKEESYKEGLEFANEIKKMLIAQGVNESNLVIQSRMDKDRLSTPNSDLNNRVDVTLYVPNAIKEDVKLEENEVIVSPVESEKFNFLVRFAMNSSLFEKGSLEKLETLKEYVLENPQYNIIITGHASKEGANSNRVYNKEISLKRAIRVKEFLKSHGIAEDRIVAIGKGFDEPIASNDTKEGREENRRVEVNLVERVEN